MTEGMEFDFVQAPFIQIRSLKVGDTISASENYSLDSGNGHSMHHQFILPISAGINQRI